MYNEMITVEPQNSGHIHWGLVSCPSSRGCSDSAPNLRDIIISYSCKCMEGFIEQALLGRLAIVKEWCLQQCQ